MEKYFGKSVSKGIAIGKISFFKRPDGVIKEAEIDDTEAEINRFQIARHKAIEEQEKLYEKAVKEAGEETAAVFEVHAMMLDDDDLVDSIKSIIEDEHKNAEFAVKIACEKQSEVFAELDDPYFKERSADIIDIGQCVIDALTGVTINFEINQENTILVADDLSPSDTVRLDKSKLAGFITYKGSSNSHTAILARNMNIPAIVKSDVIDSNLEGATAIIDGYESVVYVNPSNEVYEKLKFKSDAEAESKARLQSLMGKETVTKSGKVIHLYANMGSPDDLRMVKTNDAEGIGLFRSEFLYLNSSDYPDEETQFKAYKSVLEEMSPRKVIIRTCDIGADKKVDYMNLEPEDNPALGFRAIRICLQRKDFFKTQLRAILKASVYGNLGIMFPMIISVDELNASIDILEECKRELKDKGIPYSDSIEIGSMIETPAAVLIADELADRCDFFSIGTNDLTQYICAIDRQNVNLESVLDTHHPAVLKAIKMTIDAGHRHNCWVGICGELASDESLTNEFVKMGVDELSVSPGFILSLRNTICGI